MQGIKSRKTAFYEFRIVKPAIDFSCIVIRYYNSGYDEKNIHHYAGVAQWPEQKFSTSTANVGKKVIADNRKATNDPDAIKSVKAKWCVLRFRRCQRRHSVAIKFVCYRLAKRAKAAICQIQGSR